MAPAVGGGAAPTRPAVDFPGDEPRGRLTSTSQPPQCQWAPPSFSLPKRVTFPADPSDNRSHGSTPVPLQAQQLLRPGGGVGSGVFQVGFSPRLKSLSKPVSTSTRVTGGDVKTMPTIEKEWRAVLTPVLKTVTCDGHSTVADRDTPFDFGGAAA